jgi:hypothetical protein
LLSEVFIQTSSATVVQVAATYTTFQNSGGFFGPLIGNMVTVRYGVADSLFFTGVMYGGAF